jgi:hypothetical protein
LYVQFAGWFLSSLGRRLTSAAGGKITPTHRGVIEIVEVPEPPDG